MYDVCIIGAGVIGSFIGRELSKYKLKIAILEKNNDIGCGVSKANSAILHSGYSPKPGTIKAKYNIRSREMIDKICSDLNIEYKITGSLLVSLNDYGKESIYEKYNHGLENKVKGIKLINKEEVLKLEPNINNNVTLALYAPTTGVINPFEMVVAACENAIQNGVYLFLDSEVINIDKKENFKILCKNDKVYESKVVINCGGIDGDSINNMISKDRFFKIKPRKGQYTVLDTTEQNLVSSVIFMAKEKGDEKNRGVIITPTVNGNILLGPSAEETKNKKDINTTKDKIDFIEKSSRKILPSIDFNKKITSFSGLRPKANLLEYNEETKKIEEVKNEDFVVGESKDIKGFINVVGMKSPGLTCAPAIAEDVANIVEGLLGEFILNETFNPKVRPFIKSKMLNDKEKNERIKENSLYGKVVCNCEEVTEGEIVDMLHRTCAPTTLDGLKRRLRIGMGRCHGAFCTLKVLEIMSRELDIPINQLKKSTDKSFIFVEGENNGNE